jgi:putative hydrolase of the HAD superfamily
MPGTKKAILFDLGGTLVHYCDRREFPTILEQGINNVRDYLYLNGMLQISQEDICRRVWLEDYENEDYRVRPLEQRLIRIFRLQKEVCSDELLETICGCFMTPFFKLAQLYDDTIPVLHQLNSEGYRVAIVSNSLWGCPAHLWREEIARQGLNKLINTTVFCRDVGWCKPAHQIYGCALAEIGARAEDCLFIGDDPRWNFYGPKAVGIDAVLLDRSGEMQEVTEERIENLYQIFDQLTRLRSSENH